MPVGAAATPDDWPAYRARPERGGATTARPPARPAQLWSRKLDGGELSPPTVADGRLFVAAADRHRVYALDARDGSELWQFTAGARILAPPAYAAGTVVFGSRDGWVYALRAADGRLVWRSRAAPAARMIVVQGQLESAWPVEGSVLVDEGRVYAVAGRHTGLSGGITALALNLADGSVLWRSAPNHATFADMFVKDGEWLYMRRAQFGLADGKPPASRYQRVGNPTFQAGGISSFRQNSYAPRAQWTLLNGGASGGMLRSPILVFDDHRVAGVQTFEDPKYAIFQPSATGYRLWLRERGGDREIWSRRSPVQPMAMVLTPEQLYIAGPEDQWPVTQNGEVVCFGAVPGGGNP